MFKQNSWKDVYAFFPRNEWMPLCNLRKIETVCIWTRDICLNSLRKALKSNERKNIFFSENNLRKLILNTQPLKRVKCGKIRKIYLILQPPSCRPLQRELLSHTFFLCRFQSTSRSYLPRNINSTYSPNNRDTYSLLGEVVYDFIAIGLIKALFAWSDLQYYCLNYIKLQFTPSLCFHDRNNRQI